MAINKKSYQWNRKVRAQLDMERALQRLMPRPKYLTLAEVVPDMPGLLYSVGDDNLAVRLSGRRSITELTQGGE